MPEGVIAGGWSYVIAAYSVTAVVFLVYAWSLVKRGQTTDKAEDRSS